MLNYALRCRAQRRKQTVSYKNLSFEQNTQPSFTSSSSAQWKSCYLPFLKAKKGLLDVCFVVSIQQEIKNLPKKLCTLFFQICSPSLCSGGWGSACLSQQLKICCLAQRYAELGCTHERIYISVRYPRHELATIAMTFSLLCIGGSNAIPQPSA